MLSAGAQFYCGPGLRTIQEHVRRLQVDDTSGAWDLASADPATVSVVLNVLAVVVEDTDGRIREVTKAEAQWIVTIHQARADLSSWAIYVLARGATRREARGESLEVLTLYLALAPWRGGDEAWERYFALTGDAGMAMLREGLLSGSSQGLGEQREKGA